MKPSEIYQPPTPNQDEDRTLPPFDALLSNNPTPPKLVVPKTQSSTWSTLCPPPTLPLSHNKTLICWKLNIP